MRIGDLSHRTGVSPRMLRYYEDQGLISARRLDNGFREYDDYLVERVHKIRGLLDSGIPTRIIANILPCLHHDEIVVEDADPQLRAMLVEQRDNMTERIAILEHNRDALTRYIRAMDRAASPDGVSIRPWRTSSSPAVLASSPAQSEKQQEPTVG